MADQVTISTAQTLETRDDVGTGPDAEVRFWRGQLALAEKQDEDWVERGRKIVERYRDERNQVNQGREVRYNILWSNVETLKPVLYGRTPKPDVARRHKDENDPAASLGADIITRCLEWADDIEEFDDVMLAIVEDRLLPGRGVARVFYEPEFGEEEEEDSDVEDASFGTFSQEDVEIEGGDQDQGDQGAAGSANAPASGGAGSAAAGGGGPSQSSHCGGWAANRCFWPDCSRGWGRVSPGGQRARSGALCLLGRLSRDPGPHRSRNLVEGLSLVHDARRAGGAVW